MRSGAVLLAAGLLAACQSPQAPAPEAVRAPEPQQPSPPAVAAEKAPVQPFPKSPPSIRFTPAEPASQAPPPAPAAAPAPANAAPPAPAKAAPPAPAKAAPPAPAKASPPAPAKAAPPVPAKAEPPAPAKPAPPPRAALDLKTLEQRLKDTGAIGVLTKLTLKNQVDDLVDRFRAFHGGQRPPTLGDLRPAYELLLMKVLSLLQDKDTALAKDIDTSREAIWSVLSDREKFTRLD